MQNSFPQRLIEKHNTNDYRFGSMKYISRSLLAQKTSTIFYDENVDDEEEDSNCTIPAKRTDTVRGIVAVCLQNLERNMQLLGQELSSKHFSWTDMGDLPNTGQSSISNKAGFFLRQHLFNVLKSESKVFADPTPEILLDGIDQVTQGLNKSKRTLFMLIGQGLPEYFSGETKSISLWSTRDETIQTLKFQDLISAFKSPSCFIIDADYAGLMYDDFASKNLGNTDRYGFFSCGKDEIIPHRVGLPCDLFSSCMLTPAFVSILFGSRNFYAFKYGGLHELSLNDFSETSNNMSLLNPFSYVITKLLNVLVKAMASTVMTPLSLYNTFYRDRKIGHFYVNFCLAKKIGEEIDFHPISYPSIPDFSVHPLWEYLDMYIDRVLLQLISQNEITKCPPQQIVSQDMTKFLSDGLLAIEHGLTQQIGDSVPNEIALFPMILENPALVSRGLVALTKYIDSGEQALYKCICLNLIDSLVSIQLTNQPELVLRIAYNTAKLMCFSYRKGEGLTLFSSSASQIVSTLLSPMFAANPLSNVLALILSCIGLAIDNQTEVSLITPNIFGTMLGFTQSHDVMIQYWSLIFISLLLKSDLVSVHVQQILNVLIPAINHKNVDIKAASISAFSSLLEYSSFVLEDENEEESRKLRNLLYQTFIDILQKNKESPSHIIRMQVLFLIQCFITTYTQEGGITDTLVVESLSILSNDTHPEICMIARPLLSALEARNGFKDSLNIPSLLIGSFDAFLASDFVHLADYKEPPFTTPLTPEVITPIEPLPTKIIRNFVFSEIDHVDADTLITTNVLFLGGERIVYGDVHNTVTIRNYSEHGNELRHKPDIFFSNPDPNMPITTIFSLSGTSLILGAKNGKVSVISNACCSAPILSDSFRINNMMNLNPTNVDYEKYTHNLYAGTDIGTVECWNAFACQRTPSIPVFQTPITKLHTIKGYQSIVGAVSGNLKIIDLRDPRTPAQVLSMPTNVIDFCTIPYQGDQIIVSTNGRLSRFDMRNPSVETTIYSGAQFSNLSSCLWSPVVMGWGSSLNFVDVRNGTHSSVLASMFTKRNMPSFVTAASFHDKNQSFAFVAKGMSLHVGSVSFE